MGGFLIWFGERVLSVKRGFGWLNAPGEQQDNEDDNDEAGTASQVVVARAETITAAAEQQEDEQEKKDVHDVLDVLAVRLGSESMSRLWGVHPV